MTTNPFLDLFICAERYGNFGQGDQRAWQVRECPYCTGTQMVVIAFSNDDHASWLRCVNCFQPMIVDKYGRQSPAGRPLSTPVGVVGVEAGAWEEVRDCLSVGAYTAAVMLCRKILFHVAVGHGLPPKNDKDRAPTFLEVVDHLEAEGVFTRKMRPWIDRIKDVGNEANHDIAPASREAALDVARFTEQLLRLAYEMDALMESGRASNDT